MSAREKRVLLRAFKGFVAALIAQTLVALQQGVVLSPSNVWQLVLLPAVVALLLGLEKGLQPEKKGKP